MATSGSTKFESLGNDNLLIYFPKKGRLEGEVSVFGKKHVIFVICLGAQSGAEMTHLTLGISLVHVYIYINNGIFSLAH